MFDQEGDAMSVYSQSSRMPSLVMEPGQSMQDYYKALQLQAAELNAQDAQRVGAGRPRRNSASSVMSDTERLYGWSGSRGGIANHEQGPKYRIDSQGRLVLTDELKKKEKADQATTSPLSATSNPAAILGANNNASSTASGNNSAPVRPAIRSARSEGTKPMYRPAFAPSAVLPPSSDDEIDEDDKVIQHDLPTTRPLKARPSLKQKLGSLVARVGSVRRNGLASPPANAGNAATSPGKGEDPTPAKDYLSVKRATSSAAAYGRRTKPEFTRKGSSLAKDATPEEGAGSTDADVETKVVPADGTTQPQLTFTEANDENQPPKSPAAIEGNKSDDDKAYLSADGGFAGGMVGLARKLSRRATTGNRHRARSVPRNLREEREKQTDLLEDKEAAEKMLKELASIPLYKPPRTAHVKNRKPLSSFPPRAPLKVTSEPGSLANAPVYKQAFDDKRFRSDVGRANTTGGGNRSMHNHGRGRSGSTPSTFSSFSSQSGLPLLAGASSKYPHTIKEGSNDEDDIPPVPPLPELAKDAPVAGQSPPSDGATTNWTVFKKESSTSLNKN